MSSRPERFSYGDDALNYAELHRAEVDHVRGTIVVIHGGFWRWSREYFDGPTPLVRELAAAGYHVWQLEYRSVGSRGGWPTTFVDIDAGIARLAVVAEERNIELGPVITMGHSAGGHLAVWALGLPESRATGAPDASALTHMTLAGAISLAGVVDLRLAERENLGRGAVVDFLGGSSARYPERFESADPARHPVSGKRVRLVHGDADFIVPLSQSESYLAAAHEVGQDALLARFPGDHFDVIDPRHASFTLTMAAVEELTRG